MIDEKRIFKKNEIISIMNETRTQIVNFEKDIMKNDDKLVDIDQMISELKHLKNFVKNMKTCCSKGSKEINKSIEKIKKSTYIELQENIDVFIEVVRANLAQQVKMDIQDDESTLPIMANFMENNEKEKINIGTMNIYMENNDLKATIKFSDEEENNFTINDPYNVYPVVNCINTRYNYNRK